MAALEGFPRLWDYVSREEATTWVANREARPLSHGLLRYAGVAACFVACMEPESEIYRDLPPQNIAVIRGLLFRCYRLIRAIAKLSYEQDNRDSVAILSRSVTETGIRLEWMLNAPDGIRRFLVDSMKRDLKLEAEIRRNIEDRGGEVLKIEERMLRSIARYRRAARLTADEIQNEDGMVKYKTIIKSEYTSCSADSYDVLQSAPSDNVHGLWNDLMQNYLKFDAAGKFTLESSWIPEVAQFHAPTVATLWGASRSLSELIDDDEICDGFYSECCIAHGLSREALYIAYPTDEDRPYR